MCRMSNPKLFTSRHEERDTSWGLLFQLTSSRRAARCREGMLDFRRDRPSQVIAFRPMGRGGFPSLLNLGNSYASTAASVCRVSSLCLAVSWKRDSCVQLLFTVRMQASILQSLHVPPSGSKKQGQSDYRADIFRRPDLSSL
jgi:hypothetical protein